MGAVGAVAGLGGLQERWWAFGLVGFGPSGAVAGFWGLQELGAGFGASGAGAARAVAGFRSWGGGGLQELERWWGEGKDL